MKTKEIYMRFESDDECVGWESALRKHILTPHFDNAEVIK